MHHKFPVVDFDKPTARVYLGSYNLSVPADTKNGENLLLAHPGDAAARPPVGGQYSHLVLREGRLLR